jgi:hypothetical protein
MLEHFYIFFSTNKIEYMCWCFLVVLKSLCETCVNTTLQKNINNWRSQLKFLYGMQVD